MNWNRFFINTSITYCSSKKVTSYWHDAPNSLHVQLRQIDYYWLFPRGREASEDESIPGHTRGPKKPRCADSIFEEFLPILATVAPTSSNYLNTTAYWLWQWPPNLSPWARSWVWINPYPLWAAFTIPLWQTVTPVWCQGCSRQSQITDTQTSRCTAFWDTGL